MAKVITWPNSRLGLAAAVWLGVWQVIVVNSTFHKLREDTQLAILAHEEGHLRLRHVQQRIWWALTGLWWRDPRTLELLCQEQEFEADAYCASLGLAGPLIEFLLKSPQQANRVHPNPAIRVARLLEANHGSVRRV